MKHENEIILDVFCKKTVLLQESEHIQSLEKVIQCMSSLISSIQNKKNNNTWVLLLEIVALNIE